MRGTITKKGKKWYIVVDIGIDENGKRKQKWFSGYDRKKDAEKDLAKIINQLETNTFIMPEKTTLEEHLNYWLENYAKPNLSPTTIYGYEIIINKHIIPILGKIELQKLKPIQIQRYYDLKKEELSGKTLVQHHRVLRKALDYAFKLQLIPNNPADAVEPPKAKKYKAKVLNLEEIEAMLKALKEDKLEVPINLALALGLRRGELLGLKWEDIDLDKGLIHIKHNLVRAGKKLVLKEPKSDSGVRTLQIPSSLINMLKKHKVKQLEQKIFLGEAYNDKGFVFCREDGEPINPSTFSHWFDDFIKKNNLPDIRLHDLRHTNATLMLKGKVAPKVASKRLGHSNITITMDLYSHVLEDMDKEAANTIDNLIYKNSN